MPDLPGRVALVTGGNTGIGRATVAALAVRGAKVYLAARSQAKAMKAISDLQAKHVEIKNDQVTWLPLDLADLASVVRAVGIIKEKEDALDILVNNAGVLPDTFQTSDAGFEMTMAVCHVGHFLLTQGLLPLLRAAASRPGSDVRVVTVSSSAQTVFVPYAYPVAFDTPARLADPATDDPSRHDSYSTRMRRYGLAKLANTLFAAELQSRCDAAGIDLVSTSIHPGTVHTDGAATAMPAAWVFMLLKLVAMSPEKGATSSLFAAAAPEVRRDKEAYKGKYLDEKGRVKKPHPMAESPSVARDLWETTRAAIEEYLSKKNLRRVEML
ncbi:NAD(P)-binding protein [Thozetella sp. PMI_491]|nr:NAD(P)-binding protein [Thozetella sp. PMI_491]